MNSVPHSCLVSLYRKNHTTVAYPSKPFWMTINAHLTKHYFLTKGVFLMNCFQRNSLVSFSCNHFSLKMKLVLKLTQVFNTIVSFLCRLYAITHSIPMVTWTTLKKLPEMMSPWCLVSQRRKIKQLMLIHKKKFCMTTNVQSTNRYFLTKGVLWKNGFFGNILVSLFLLSFLP